MKKLTVCALAIAAMALTMTSCNKEEANITESINIAFEDNEIMNDAKTHIDGFSIIWDAGDRVTLLDASRNSAVYTVENAGDFTLHFNSNTYGTFDANNGPISAFYPTTISYKRLSNVVKLPTTQTTADGTMSNFPMYCGDGTLNNFQFRNICGVLRMTLSSPEPIDSIAVTTDQYLNGFFYVNMNNTYPLSYQSNGHGTKTNTLVFTESLETAAAGSTVDIYLPANSYKTMDLAFYSNGEVARKHLNAENIVISRTAFNYLTVNLTSDDFDPFINGLLEVAAYQTNLGDVMFAQANLIWNGTPTGGYYRLGNNQWDFSNPTIQGQSGNQIDRDIFCWGAASPNNNTGARLYNSQVKNSTFRYYNGNLLANEYEWGTYKIKYGGEEEWGGWRVLTTEEWDYLLDNCGKSFVALSFVNVEGLLIYPTTYAEDNEFTTMTKAQWYDAVEHGAVFFPAAYYRAYGSDNARPQASIPTTAGMSYYWTANGVANTNNAYALMCDAETGTADFEAIHKRSGAYVRLVKDIAL